MKHWWNNSDQESLRQIGSFSDPFDPYLVYGVIVDKTHGFKSVVFGWDTMHLDKPSDDRISKLFERHGEFNTGYM